MDSEHETTTLSSIPDELLYAAILEPLSVLELRVAACTCNRWRDAIPAQARLFSCIVTSAGSNEVMLFDARGRLTASFRALPPPPPSGGEAATRAAEPAPGVATTGQPVSRSVHVASCSSHSTECAASCSSRAAPTATLIGARWRLGRASSRLRASYTRTAASTWSPSTAG